MRFPKLNESQLEKLSDIFSDLALISTGSVVLPTFLDKFNASAVLLGSVIAVICWFVSLLLRKGIK